MAKLVAIGMKMGKRTLKIFTFSICYLACNALFADIVRLTNGKTISGRIIKVDINVSVMIKGKSGTETIMWDEIVSFEEEAAEPVVGGSQNAKFANSISRGPIPEERKFEPRDSFTFSAKMGVESQKVIRTQKRVRVAPLASITGIEFHREAQNDSL